MGFQQERSGPQLVYERGPALDATLAAHVRQLVLALDLPERTTAELVRVVDRETRSEKGWPFVMLSPRQNKEVVSWIFSNSKHPRKCARLWAELFVCMRNDTGEILATRGELAAAVGVPPDEVSRMMGELASTNAVIKVKDGRRVRYFMNANVATTLPGKARDDAQQDAGPLLLIMDGGKA